MRDVLPQLLGWQEAGRRFALATVVDTWGSSPRPVGSVMAVREDGLVVGSVSGGCVEGSVIREALASLVDGRPRHLSFGQLSPEQVWEVGLSCGGRIEVWVDPDPVSRDPALWCELVARVEGDRPTVLVVHRSDMRRRLWKPGESDAAAEEAYAARTSRKLEDAESVTFYHVLPRRERLVIVGASHIALPLIAFARPLGFECVVVEPRTQLTSLERFPTAPDRIVPTWPKEAFETLGLTPDTYLVVLTHDPKIDDPAIALALRSDVAYIGALGSRTTQRQRRQALAEQGFSDADLDRIHGPVGLAIGARTPEEIALSIAAELVKVRRERR